MTTVVNNPGNGSNTDGGAGVVIGAVLVLLVLIGAIILALPYLREQVEGMKPENPTINVTLPEPTMPTQPPASGTPQP
jgi:hypothetical protein